MGERLVSRDAPMVAKLIVVNSDQNAAAPAIADPIKKFMAITAFTFTRKWR